MIICGFAGTGKSTAAKKIRGVIDLESTPFHRDWDTYARVAIHMEAQGYIILLSCHQELREKLHELGARYYVVYPEKDQKELYRQRYKARGNSQDFITMQMNHWDTWIGMTLEWKVVDEEKNEKIESEQVLYLDTTPSGHVENMTDLLDDLLRYGEKVVDLFPPIS